LYIKWNLTKKCSLNCRFCHNALKRKEWEKDLDFHDIHKAVKNLNESNNVMGITLLGGEPTEAENFFEVCNALKNTDIKFGFITSGEHICENKFEEIIFNQNLKFIGISIDSLCNEKVEYIRGRDILDLQLNGLDKILRIKEENGLKFDIFINTILMKPNINDIQDIIQYFYNKNVKKVQILGYNRSDAKSKELALSVEEEYEIVERLADFISKNIEEWKKNDFKLRLNFLPPIAADYINKKYNLDIFDNTSFSCPIYRDTVFISNDGHVYPCDSYKPYIITDDDNNPIKVYEIDNINKKSFNEIIKNEFFLELKGLMKKKDIIYKSCSPCNECSQFLKTCYPCIKLAMYEGDVEFEKCHYYKNKIYEEKLINE